MHCPFAQYAKLNTGGSATALPRIGFSNDHHSGSHWSQYVVSPFAIYSPLCSSFSCCGLKLFEYAKCMVATTHLQPRSPVYLLFINAKHLLATFRLSPSHRHNRPPNNDDNDDGDDDSGHDDPAPEPCRKSSSVAAAGAINVATRNICNISIRNFSKVVEQLTDN